VTVESRRSAEVPTAELDEDTAALVVHELRSVTAGGSAVVIATHDPGAIAASDRVVALRHGVMSTEQWGATTARATIDPAGRVQLPPDALELFPNRRASSASTATASCSSRPGRTRERHRPGGHGCRWAPT
jgi:ABC-type glutathione transport system ATPase component